MKYITLILSLLFSTGAWAQSYLCKPIKSCTLSEGVCELQAGNQAPSIVKLSEKVIAVMRADIEAGSNKVFEAFEGEGNTNYFGIVDSDHILVTIYKDGSIFLFGVITEDDNSAVIAELSCEVPLSSLNAEQHILAQGRNRFTDTGQVLLADPEVRRSFLGG